MSSSNQEDLVAQFSAVTGANPSVAQNALQSANWNLEEAVSLFYTQTEEQGEAPFNDDEPQDPIAPAPTQQPAASQPAASSSSSSRTPYRGGGPRAVTLSDLQRGGDDDDDDDDKDQDLFAGGEKSGLAVQNPGQGGPPDHFRNIMNRARQNRDRPPAADDEEEEAAAARPSNFSGRAQTLGGDDAPSRVIEDPRGAYPTRQTLPRVTRTLHLWADGVSIDDGPLLRFDDPANEHIMAEINQGRAPKALLDVQPDQEVDLNLDPHKGENYVPPKKKYQPFGGQGQRLGSPTPGLVGGGASSSAAAAASSSSAVQSSSASTAPQEMNIDESQPTVQLQIRLGDGARLVSRFNTTHTIGDVYDFVTSTSPASQQRAFVLMTTFPSQELSDKAKVLGEMSDFKRGGVVVQKWK